MSDDVYTEKRQLRINGRTALFSEVLYEKII